MNRNKSDSQLAKNYKGVIGKIFIYLLLTIVGILMMIPFLWMVLGAFKSLKEIMISPPTFIPKEPTFKNFIQVFKKIPFARYYLNTAFVTIIPTIVTVLTAAMAGFGFAKYKFKGAKFLFGMILATMMIPYPVTIVPLYVMAFKAGLINTYTGLIVVGLSSAFGIFLMRQFIMSIPDALLDAARIDGCSEFRIFYNIVLPLCKPAVATLTLFSFTSHWNSYIWPLMIINSEKLRTLSIAIPMFNGQYEQYPNLVYAASLMSLLPIIIIFIFAQRYFVEGINLSGVKE
ncbi:MAG: carbohydrate ABC transporter permease [Halanaerobiales bacterium]|nr:carbohydrate ABC transporter permease [Halanaerobiales bacterium]